MSPGKWARDYQEVERMGTPERWQAVIDELGAEAPEVATQLEEWLTPHKGHRDVGLRWNRPDGTSRWYVNAECRQCRVSSAERFVGED